MAAEAPAQRHRLTEAQKHFFKENGYLIGLPPVYAPTDVGFSSPDQS